MMLKKKVGVTGGWWAGGRELRVKEEGEDSSTRHVPSPLKASQCRHRSWLETLCRDWAPPLSSHRPHCLSSSGCEGGIPRIHRWAQHVMLLLWAPSLLAPGTPAYPSPLPVCGDSVLPNRGPWASLGNL